MRLPCDVDYQGPRFHPIFLFFMEIYVLLSYLTAELNLQTMNDFIKFFCATFISASMFLSCSPGIDLPSGEICFNFTGVGTPATKSGEEIPDTNDFILTVTDASGAVYYSGCYGSAPECLTVPSGNYSIDVVSSEFLSPMFDAPVYGDSRVILVSPGKRAEVMLECRRMNCGVRMKIVPEFLDSYPDAALFLTSDSGKLMYGYNERRTAYFKPGNVSLMMSRGAVDEILRTRWLEAGEMLSLNVSVASGDDSSGDSRAYLSISIDTSAVWLEDEYILGEYGEKGSCPENAFNVFEARDRVGEKDVWVFGYIVGGDLTSTSASFGAPFKSDNNILIASKPSAGDRSSCLSAQLPKGPVRDSLGPASNPDVLGRGVFLNGDIVDSYYGLCGIKDVRGYKLAE